MSCINAFGMRELHMGAGWDVASWQAHGVGSACDAQDVGELCVACPTIAMTWAVWFECCVG